MNARSNAPEILLLGSESGFSFHALKALLDLRLPVAEVLVAAGDGDASRRPVMRGSLPLLQPGSLADLAAREGISVISCRSTREDWAFELAREMAPELILVACLPERLDQRWRELCRGACFNLHPSLLPAYRGPAPLFWQLRDGLSRVGITVHRVESTVDAGALLAQEEIGVGDDDNLATLNAALAATGVRLFARSLEACLAGTATLVPQDEAKASYRPWPKAEDFTLDTRWPAARAFRFVRATQSLGTPYRVEVEGAAYLIDRVVALDLGAAGDEAISEAGGVLTIRFADGVLKGVGKRRDA
ncbi:MAG: formyltransferase family protein [Gammaproteobacteria bacterium]|nr:formyltransferase family protein [Gammaproteobacteria bacterium]